MANLTTVFQESSEPVRLSRSECSPLPGENGVCDLFPKYLQGPHLSCSVAVEVMQPLDKIVRDLGFFSQWLYYEYRDSQIHCELRQEVQQHTTVF